MWTQFMDMCSGGGSKEPYKYIYIEAPQTEAALIFYNRFKHSPFRVTCTCCGEDYALTEADSLEQATAYNRGCAYSKSLDQYEERPNDLYKTHGYHTLAEYLLKTNILVIRDQDIKPEERVGDVPQQGYVWQD